MYSNTIGATSCDKCMNSEEYGAEYTSSVGATSCDLCTKDFFMDNDGACVSCDELIYSDHDTSEAVECPEGSTLASVRVKSGFYRFSVER